MFSIETSRILRRTLLTLMMTGLAVALARTRWNSRSARANSATLSTELDHLLVDGLHLGQVLVGGAFGGQGGRTLLDDLPVFENLQDVDIVQDQKGDKGIEVDLAAAQFADKGALTVPRFQNPQGDQVLDAFPDGDPAHAHGPGKLVFGGKFAAGRPGAAKNLIAELPEDLAADALFFDGFEHVYHPKIIAQIEVV